MEMRYSGWKIQLSLLGAIIWKNILEYRRYPMEIAFTFLMPIVWLLPTYFLIISFAPTGQSVGLASWIGSNNFFSFYMIGIIVGYFTATIFWSMGFSLKRLMDIGMLETIWVCPISKLMYIIGESLFSMLRLIYEMTILIIMYRFVFRMAIPPAIWQTLPYFIPFIFLMYGFGIAFASLVLLVKDANTMVDTSSFLVQTLSGVQNPPQVFPRFFLAISLAIPITYFLDIIRVQTLAIKPLVPYGLELFIFLAASLLFPIGGIWLFNCIDRKCRIQGSLHVH
jgi:ABC-2 type transport system permease protein